ncbi:acyl-CoA thioesterase [Thalassobius sp. S69A]|uniref:acyl-CoA thioesterase n=1 Tax=unclassified Thalassovita TaxID=2619711 RepID=UPI003C7E1855|tara:strand:- start:44 stop:439 length:396 start_codon:yes stop_codon:yes gene_type:complete
MQHCYQVQVSFGDCDPAGIVYYPNTFRWMDACFHDALRPFGGHAAICQELQATGIGLVDSGAQFRTPLRDGDRLNIRLTVLDWARKTLTLGYEGHVAERLAFTGKEVRCLFQPTAKGLSAGNMSLLRDRLS